jgi:hypothetical protein
VRREPTAGHQPDLQFDELGFVRWIGEREGAPLAVVKDDVDVLPGLEA